VLICDFGGSSLDCAVTVGGERRLEVTASGGDGFLGGAEFDLAIADALAGQVFRATRADLRSNLLTWAELVRRCEVAKRRLSTEDTARLELPDALARGGTRVGIGVNLERSAVERLWQPFIDRAVQAADRVLREAGLPAALIDDLVLVGGTNLVPAVRGAFVRRMARQPSALVASDVAVAVGLAWVAAGDREHSHAAG
jgi:molecular chaperone DnaK